MKRQHCVSDLLTMHAGKDGEFFACKFLSVCTICTRDDELWVGGVCEWCQRMLRDFISGIGRSFWFTSEFFYKKLKEDFTKVANQRLKNFPQNFSCNFKSRKSQNFLLNLVQKTFKSSRQSGQNMFVDVQRKSAKDVLYFRKVLERSKVNALEELRLKWKSFPVFSSAY